MVSEPQNVGYRILQLPQWAPTAASGQLEAFVEILCGNQGIDGLSFVIAGNLDSRPELRNRLMNAGISLLPHHLPSPFHAPGMFFRSLAALRRHPALADLCLVHAHQHYLGPALLARIRRVPLVLTSHSQFLDKEGKAVLRSIRRKLMRRVLANAAAVVAISEKVQASIRAFVGIPDLPVHRIYYGMDTQRFSPGTPGEIEPLLHKLRSQRRHIAVTVGKLAPYKNPHMVLDIASHTRRSLPEWIFVFVGDEGPLATEIHQRVLDEDLADRVRFLGFRTNIVDIYRQADILLHTATEEAFGLVFTEAMSCGLPVVAAAGSAIHEIDPAGELVSICQLADREVWTRSLRKLQDAGVRKEIGNRSRQHVMLHYSWDRCCREYRELLLRVIREQES